MSKNQTIIIKKIKKGGHGHHGGAWKVAYADFVTAMMAFFLLLWILTATPVEQLEGLADYFSPTLGLQGKMGIGFAGGKAPNTEGWSAGDWASMGLVFGAAPSGPIIKLPTDENNRAEETEPINFEDVQTEIREVIEHASGISKHKDSILIEQTPEGIRIQITDKETRPMFSPGSAELLPHAKNILSKITSIVSHIPNYIEISGHVSSGFEYKDPNYTGWELSADRANAARRYMKKAGIMQGQVVRVVGKSDNDLLNTDNRHAPENSRISILMLTKSIHAYHNQPAPEEIILGPLEEGLKKFIQLKHKAPQIGVNKDETTEEE